MKPLTPCLWFDGQAEDAATFYTGIFPDGRIDSVDRSPGEVPGGETGAVMTVNFTINGMQFIGLNGGPDYSFNEAISFMVHCEDQAEVDRYWEALTAGGGEPGPCGWLKDRFGVSWQVIPKQLFETIGGSDRAGADRALQAMLKMHKIDVAALQAAYAGTDS